MEKFDSYYFVKLTSPFSDLLVCEFLYSYIKCKNEPTMCMFSQIVSRQYFNHTCRIVGQLKRIIEVKYQS